MHTPSLLKMLQKFSVEVATSKPNWKMPKQRALGYSLVEVLVVVIMIGVLAAIAAPSWLAFLNRQRVNKASDAVLAAIQEAQRKAKKTKFSYSVSFKNDTTSKLPKFVIYPTPSATIDWTTYPWQTLAWQTLGGDLGIQSGQIVLGTNFKTGNNGVNSVTSDNSGYYSSNLPTNPPPTITFDYLGTSSSTTVHSGVTAAVVQPGNPSQPTGVKRCVYLASLLGSVSTAKDNNCP